MVDRGRLDYCKDLTYVDSRIRSSAPSEKIEPLREDFEPGHWDVICQGGKESYDHSKCALGSCLVSLARR
jgi:hypothetical protein